MKVKLLGLGALTAICAFAADPSIREGSVTMTQAMSRLVTISYELEDNDAIVTLDITTNGVSIGKENIRGLVGDVNRRVAPGRHTITWKPNESWPGHVIKDGSAQAVVTAWHPSVPPPYMVVGLSTQNSVRYFLTEEEIDGGITNSQYKREFMVLRKVPAYGAIWRMGTYDAIDAYADSSQKAHLVTFTNDFYVSIYPVTQGQFASVMGSGWVNSCGYNSGSHSDWWSHPMEKVSYNKIRGSNAGARWPTEDAFDDGSFCAEILSRTGVRFDLPTDAEWEFAARAGNPNPSAVADDGHTADQTTVLDFAWVGNNSDGHTHEVGTRRPNAWGIYDMQGNTWEMCRDWYEDVCTSPADGSPVISPMGPVSGTVRVLRSCAYNNSQFSLQRFVFRNNLNPSSESGDMGFRLVHEVTGE